MYMCGEGGERDRGDDNTLKLPIILAVVGSGSNWRATQVHGRGRGER